MKIQIDKFILHHFNLKRIPSKRSELNKTKLISRNYLVKDIQFIRAELI